MALVIRLRLCLLVVMVLLAAAAPGCKERAPSASASAAAPAAQATGFAMAVDAVAAAPSASGGAKPGDAQKKEAATWRRSEFVANTARLAVGDKETLPLLAVQASVHLDGFRARVVLDYYFANDRDRSYEGTFQLRLPNDASPYYFAYGETRASAAEPPPLLGSESAGNHAFEPASLRAARDPSWSAPKEARMVPREKAAAAYEATVRRRVDPGLVEWAGAGIFNARVFPLAPHRIHRIVIGYDVYLVPVEDDLEYTLDLPDDLARAVVDVSVSAPPGVAVGVTPAATPSKGVYHFDNPKQRPIAVRLKKPGPLALTFADPRTQSYSAIRLRPGPGAPAAAVGDAAETQPAAVFLVDTSLSASPDKLNVWLKLLEAILENNRGSLKKFAVLFFNVETLWFEPRLLDNTPENVQRLLAFARGLAVEGATDLGAAFAQAARPAWAAAEEGAWDVFFLSDGASTWGEADRFTLSRILASGHARALYAYQTGLSGTDGDVLAHLARESGGALFSAAGEAEVTRVSTAHRARPWQIERVDVPGMTDVVLAGRPRTLFAGQALVIAGRGVPEAGAEVSIDLRRDGKTRTVREKIGAPLASPLAPRIYGQIAVHQLEDFDAATEDLATTYATYFRVTGRACSLLVLESEADYQRFHVRAEDPGAVQASPAAEAVLRAWRRIGDALGDPKVGFMAWLAGLERLTEVKITLPAGLRAALDPLPSARFSVEVPPLAPRLHTASAIPGAYRELLSIHRIEYEAVSQEAARRLAEAGPADALKALSSLVEESPGDAVLARDVAFSAMEWGMGGQAYHLFRRVAEARPYDPQSYRAMAACLVQMKNADLAVALFEVGLAGQWDDRFGDFRRILGLEYLHLVRRIAGGQLQADLKDYALGRVKALEAEFTPAKADLVVMITWNTDNTDVDLHVVEPSGEECFYSHRDTAIGGSLTKDVTRGFGPEMYVLPHAAPGAYQIRAHYYAADQNRASVRTKVQAQVFEDWGSPGEKVTEKVVTLETGKQAHDIATVTR
jgi:hypothetical protein